MVDADEPEARDGVRMLDGTSSLGKRDVELCGDGLGRCVLEVRELMGIAKPALP